MLTLSTLRIKTLNTLPSACDKICETNFIYFCISAPKEESDEDEAGDASDDAAEESEEDAGEESDD